MVGIDWIGLALHPTHAALGSDHLTDLVAGAAGGGGDPGAVGAGAFDADTRQVTETGQERQGVPVAVGGGGELPVPERAAEGVDGGDVEGVSVGINTAHHTRNTPGRKHRDCHDGTAFRIDGWSTPVGRADRTLMRHLPGSY